MKLSLRKMALAAVLAFAGTSMAQDLPTLYMMGAGDGIGWDFPGKEITATGDQYVITVKNLTKFKISTVRATDWEGDGQFNSGAFGWNTNTTQLGDAVATAAGQTVNLEPWGEDLEMPWTGDYTITINGARTTMNVKTTTPKPTNGPAIYIRGGMNGWGSPAAWQLTCESWDGNSGVYTYTGTIPAGQEFKIADANWGTANYTFNNTNLTPELNKVYNLAYNGGNSKLAAEFTGTLTLNITNYTGHVATAVFSDGTGGEIKYAENYYLIGTINGEGWNPKNVAKMAGNGEGVYTIEGVTLAENGGSTGFAITGFDGTSEDWNAVNAERYGPAVKDTKAVIGENKVDGMGDCSWTIDPGTYNMVFDIKAKTLTISGSKAEVVIPDVIYLRGGAGDDSWGDNTANAMAKLEEMTGDGGYQYQAKFAAITDEFKFASDPISWDNLVLNMGAGDNRVATNHATLVAVKDGQNFQVANGGLKNVTVTFVYAPEGTSRVNFEAEEVVPTITMGNVTVSDVTAEGAKLTATYTAENVEAPNAVFVDFTYNNLNTRVEGVDGTATATLEGLTPETVYTYSAKAVVLNTQEGYRTVAESSEVASGQFTTEAAPAVEPTNELKLVWKKENFGTVAPGEARSATGTHGKVYFTNKAATKVQSIDQDGNVEDFATVAGLGTGIGSDDAGNIIVNRGFSGANSGIFFTVISADGVHQKDFTVDLPLTAGRTDYVGRVVGDMFSEEGGYFYLAETNLKQVIMVKVSKGGEEFSATASKVEAGYAFDATSIAHPLLTAEEMAASSQPEDNYFVRRRGGANGVVTMVDNGVKSNLPGGKPTTKDGFAAFKFNGSIIQVLPGKVNSSNTYGNEYQIIVDGEVLETVTLGVDNSSTSSMNFAATGRQISDTQAEIYLYVNDAASGQCAAMYTYGYETPEVPVEPAVTLDEVAAPAEYITATTAIVIANYTAENLVEGQKVVVKFTDTNTGESVEVDGTGESASYQYEELEAETEYTIGVNAYVYAGEEIVASATAKTVTFKTLAAPKVITLELGEMTAETTTTTAKVTVPYTVENLPEGGKVVAQVMLNTDKRETVTVEGEDGKAVAEFKDLTPDTTYEYMVTAYVVDAEGNQNYETRRMAQNAFTTEPELAFEPEDKAHFAYNLNAEKGAGTTYVLTFNATGDVKTAYLVLTNVETGETYEEEIDGVYAGENTYTFDSSVLDKTAAWNWAIRLHNNAIEETIVTDLGAVGGSRAGLAVFNDPEFPETFGYVVVGRTQNGGIDVYNPNGQLEQSAVHAGCAAIGNTNTSSPMDATQRGNEVYLASWGDASVGVVAYDITTPDVAPYAVFEGTKEANGKMVTADGVATGSGTPCVGIWGEGEETTIITFDEDIFANKLAMNVIGTGKTTANPAQLIGNGFNAQLANTNVGVATTKGGFFASQCRANGMEETTSGLRYFARTEDGNFDSVWKVFDQAEEDATLLPSALAGIGLSYDESKIVVPGYDAIYVYDVNWNDNVPSLSNCVTIANPYGRQQTRTNARFDAAGNIYLTQQSAGFYRITLANEEAKATTPAPKASLIESATGVDNIAVDADEAGAVYYNLNGVQMPANAKLPAGVYVKVVGKTATKVVVK